MMNNEWIHHYTSLDTLELILKSGRIRFSRLDMVDDLNESKAYGDHDFSKFLFVSCWTDLGEESIPQWKMYADLLKGVRISLPKNFFPQYPFDPPPTLGITVQDRIRFPVRWDEIFTAEYWLQPIFLYESWFGKKVTYIDNIIGLFKNNFSLSRDVQGRENLNIQEMNTFACYKQKEWQFQSEYRFILCAFPPLKFPAGGFNNGHFVEKYSIHHVECIKEGRHPSVEFIDIDFGNGFQYVRFTLGPKCDEYDVGRLLALTKKYAPSATISKSTLSGTIR
ncbi:MAG TPA: hypothetical protein PKG49_11740 [Nitrosomonas mobilis]|nr:hypothetical protein [Nitrosomonas mobilis]